MFADEMDRGANSGTAAAFNGGSQVRPLRFLFTTLQHVESDFYGRVGAELRRRGHEVAHVTCSRRAAALLGRKGFKAYCLPDRMAALGDDLDSDAEAARIAGSYDVATFRDIYRTDFVCDGRSEEWCVERTVRHVMALERIFDEWQPEVVVPEVGNETIRRGAHLVGLARGVPVLFLFYTIFPDPLRLYIDTMDAPIVSPEDVRELRSEERDEVERFVEAFIRRDEPIRAYRRTGLTRKRLRMFARHLAVQTFYDRDNEYLRPVHWTLGVVREVARARAARAFYEGIRPSRPYVYFPLHIVDDYKLKCVVPHCADQLAIVEQVARSLPHGHDLVVKEHPMSIGRNSLSFLARLRRMRNVRVVPPRTSSHELTRGSRAVVVISSTVGLEALLHGRPVLTLGRPFYSGFGITRDLDGPSGIREAVPALLSDEPDRERILQFLHAARQQCHPGAPVLVDDSDRNAADLAGSLEAVGRKLTASRLGSHPTAASAAPAAISGDDGASGVRQSGVPPDR